MIDFASSNCYNLKRHECKVTQQYSGHAWNNSSLSRRTDEMANDVQNQQPPQLQVKKFAQQINKSCLQDNEVVLLTYVTFLADNQL